MQFPFVSLLFGLGLMFPGLLPALPMISDTGWFPPFVMTCSDGYRYGETYPAPDGCNTCSCTENGIACTLMACEQSSSVSSASQSTKCLSSNQCSADEYCTTEEGDCQSACESGAEVCIQACAGNCVPRAGETGSRSSAFDECAPYVCKDGSMHPACTDDGHVINYFVDPCFRDYMGGESSASSDASQQQFSCSETQNEYNAVVAASRQCTADSDCLLFEQSCPYVTCGTAVRADRLADVRDAADEYVECVEESGGPVACAACIAMRAACVKGRCTEIQQ